MSRAEMGYHLELISPAAAGEAAAAGGGKHF